MDPRLLIPREVEAELTPMGRRPLNRWVITGAGGDPYEPRGLYPNNRGSNRLAPGYDGISPSHGSRAHRTVEGFAMSMENQRLRHTWLGDLGQDAPSPVFDPGGPGCMNVPAPISCFTCAARGPEGRLGYRVHLDTAGRASCIPVSGHTSSNNGGNGSRFPVIALVLGLAVGAGLAYITYDEALGYGSRLPY